MKKSIKFSQNEFEILLKAVTLAGTIYALMGDMVDEKYKSSVDQMDNIENILCSLAKEFGLHKIVEYFDGKTVMDMEGKWFENVMADLDEYEEFATFDKLSHKLAHRDFYREHSEEEIKKLIKEHGGYIGVLLYDYEKKYWDEFETHDYDRLEIVES